MNEPTQAACEAPVAGPALVGEDVHIRMLEPEVLVKPAQLRPAERAAHAVVPYAPVNHSLVRKHTVRT